MQIVFMSAPLPDSGPLPFSSPSWSSSIQPNDHLQSTAICQGAARTLEVQGEISSLSQETPSSQLTPI